MGLPSEDSDIAQDFEEEDWPGIDHEQEYIDEDRYTTVTVEAVDVSKAGLQRVAEEHEEELVKDYKPASDESKQKKQWPKKEKKQKFRYESKAERRATRSKQKAGNKAKADLRRDK